MFLHQRTLPLFRGAETSAYCRSLSGFPVHQSAAQSIGNTFRDNIDTVFPRRECLFGQGEFF
jgi:hypothetical protein